MNPEIEKIINQISGMDPAAAAEFMAADKNLRRLEAKNGRIPGAILRKVFPQINQNQMSGEAEGIYLAARRKRAAAGLEDNLDWWRE